MSPHSLGLAVGAALVVGYAWFATGVKPFHALAYVVIAVPVLVVVGLYAFGGAFGHEGPGGSRPSRVSMGRSTPWLLVLVGVVVLEAVGLILGGRSSRVPTLSTMMDHLLTTHWLRCVLFVLWLAVGAAPWWRRRQRRRHAVRE